MSSRLQYKGKPIKQEEFLLARKLKAISIHKGRKKLKKEEWRNEY